MARYQQLKIGVRYGVQHKRKVRSGKYLGRYFNNVLKQWHYHFELFYGMYWTPPASECKILLGG